MLTTAFSLGLAIAVSAQAENRGASAPSQPAAAPTTCLRGLPAIHWPVADGYRRLFPDRVSILEPRFSQLSDECLNRLLLYAGGKIEALDPPTGQPAWVEPLPSRSQPDFLGVVAGLDVFATKYRIFAVADRTGRVAWSFGEEPKSDPNADPEATAAWVRHFLTEDRLFCLDNQGRLICLDPRDGSLLWRREEAGRSGSLLAADRRRVVVATWQNDTTLLATYDADTGRPGGLFRVDEGGPVLSLLPADAATLLAITSDAVVAVDLHSFAPRYRLAIPERIVLSSVHALMGGIIVGDQTRRLATYDLTDGHLVWRTPALDPAEQGPPWVDIWEDRLLVASAGTLRALRATDGTTLWTRKEPWLLDAQAPLLTRDAVLVIAHEAAAPTATSARNRRPPAGDGSQGVRYRMRAYGRSGDPQPIIPGNASLLSEPLASFRGLYARNGCMALIDGNRLIGYVAPPVTTQRGAATR